MRKFHLPVLISLFCSLLFLAKSAFATLDLELTQGADKAIPIAILPFSGQELISNADNNVRDVISNDLRNSGRFNVYDESTLLPSLKTESSINFAFWKLQKVSAVVTGQISMSGNKYQVAFKLTDIYSKSILLERSYSVSANELRPLAHHISDLIYKQLTGERGIFSTRIAYITTKHSPDGATTHALEVADADGFNPRTLIASKWPLMSPEWSPDGTKIAYVSFENNHAAIYVQDVASGERHVVSQHAGINGAPSWSPDGRKLALVLSEEIGYPKIYVLDLATKQLTRLTSDWYLDTEPAWAPDSRSIIFTSNRGGSPQIYRVALADKKISRVTFRGNYNARASFTPDGKSIVMLHQENGTFNVAMQDLDSGRVAILTHTDFNESPSIAPNGKMIVYATSDNNRGALAAVSIDGKIKLTLPGRDGAVQEPAWSPFLDKIRN